MKRCCRQLRRYGISRYIPAATHYKNPVGFLSLNLLKLLLIDTNKKIVAFFEIDSKLINKSIVKFI